MEGLRVTINLQHLIKKKINIFKSVLGELSRDVNGNHGSSSETNSPPTHGYALNGGVITRTDTAAEPRFPEPYEPSPPEQVYSMDCDTGKTFIKLTVGREILISLLSLDLLAISRHHHHLIATRWL